MRKFIYLFVFITMIAVDNFAQIKVSANNKFLTNSDGTPFFWLGDTDWELCHRLTRAEVDEVINTRFEQGFNVLQVVALAEMNGLRDANRYGDWPLNNEDPTQLATTPGNNPENEYEYDYWDHLEYVIKKAAEKNIYVGLLPTWGDKVTVMWGAGPRIFDEKNAETYGKLIATRFAAYHKNIIWILGGDRPAVYKAKSDGEEKTYNETATWRAMAKGIHAIAGENAFIAYHPSGGDYSTSQYIPAELWLDMNAFQSGHGAREIDSWNWVARDLSVKPLKPVVDLEPCYEDHPVNPWDGKWTRRERGYFTAYDVRARVYRDVFAGAAGVTYGHHSIWQFYDQEHYKPIYVGDTSIVWKQALHAEAAGQMKYLKKLMLSRPYFSRVEDSKILLSTQGTTYIDVITSTRDEERTYAMVYLPQNNPVKVDLNVVTGKAKNIWWFDPRTGKSTVVEKGIQKKIGTFAPPKTGKDWILVIDDASKKYQAPGQDN